LKICPAGDEFCADRRTDRHADMMKLTVTLHNFANEHKKLLSVCGCVKTLYIL